MTQRRYQLVVVGQCSQDFRRRKRDMDKEADLVVAAAIAKRLGQRNQMIVVHPNHVVRLKQWLELGGEILIDPEIATEVTPREFGKIEPVMQYRPQHAIGEPVVEFLVIVLA